MRIGKDETWKKIHASLFRDASFDPSTDGVPIEELAAEMGVDVDTAEEKYLKHCDAEVKHCKQCGYEHPIGEHDEDIQGDHDQAGSQPPSEYMSMPSSEGNGVIGGNDYDDVLEAAVLAQIAKGIDPLTARENAEEILAQDPRWSFSEAIIPKSVPKSKKPGRPSPPPPGKTENPRYELQNKPSQAAAPRPSAPPKSNPFTDAHVDKIPGGKGDNAQPKDFDKRQLAKGLKHEMEHTNDPSIAVEIAMDHLTEDPNYYDKLDKVEESAKDKKPTRKPPVSDTCDDCGADVAACGCKNVAYADEQPAGSEMSKILEELSQSAYNKNLDELTYQELFALQEALRQMAQPKVYEIPPTE